MKNSLISLAATLLCAASISSASALELEGNGTEKTPYLIKTTNDLDALALSVNNGTNYEGVYFQLENSLDYENQNYTPIGTLYKENGKTVNRPFKGFFNGNGQTISNITINNGIVIATAGNGYGAGIGGGGESDQLSG